MDPPEIKGFFSSPGAVAQDDDVPSPSTAQLEDWLAGAAERRSETIVSEDFDEEILERLRMLQPRVAAKRADHR